MIKLGFILECFLYCNSAFMIIIMRLLCLMDQLMPWCELVDKIQCLWCFRVFEPMILIPLILIWLCEIVWGVLLPMLLEAFLFNSFVFWIRFTRLAWELDCWKHSLSCFGLISLLHVDDYNTYICIWIVKIN